MPLNSFNPSASQTVQQTGQIPKGMKVCKTCGYLVAKSAKKCPHCGAKLKMPTWLVALIALFVLGFLGSMRNGGSSNKKPSSQNDSGYVTSAQSVDREEASTTGAESAPQVEENKEEMSATGAESEPPAEEQTREYRTVSIQELHDALEANAMNAKNTYEGEYIEFTGYLGSIDASGDHVSVDDGSDWASLTNYSVTCYTKRNEEAINVISQLTTGDSVLVRGRIKSVGEWLGYSVDIDSIEAL